MENENTKAAIARLIISTKTKKRQFSLFEIAQDIRQLKHELGGMQKISEILGISTGMLNQFLSVYKLPDEVIDLVKNRKIESVSIIHHLAKFSNNDALELSDFILKKDLSSQDLRVLLPLKKQFPQASIEELINKIKKSKNIKVSVIRIPKELSIKNITLIREALENLIGEKNCLQIENTQSYIDIKVTPIGEKMLRQIAATQKKSMQELIYQLIK